MNVLRKKVPPLKLKEEDAPEPKQESEPKQKVKEPEPVTIDIKETPNAVAPKQETTPDYIKPDAHAFAPPKEAPKGKKKKQLSEKQTAHLARIRAKALESKRLKREEKEREKEAKKAERLLKKEEAELLKAQRDDDKERKRKEKEDALFNARMDAWYEKKQAKKQARRNIAKKQAPVKSEGEARKNEVRKVAQKPVYKNPNRRYDPFASGFAGSGRRKIDPFGRFTF